MKHGFRIADTDAHHDRARGSGATTSTPGFRERAPRLQERPTVAPTLTVEGESLHRRRTSTRSRARSSWAAARRDGSASSGRAAPGFSAASRARGHGRAGRRRADPLSRPSAASCSAASSATPSCWPPAVAPTTTGARSTAAPRRSACAGRRCCRCRTSTCAIDEARRAAADGAVGVLRAPESGHGPQPLPRDYVPLWAEIEQLDRPDLHPRLRLAAPAVVRRAHGHAHHRPHPRASRSRRWAR